MVNLNVNLTSEEAGILPNPLLSSFLGSLVEVKVESVGLSGSLGRITLLNPATEIEPSYALVVSFLLLFFILRVHPFVIDLLSLWVSWIVSLQEKCNNFNLNILQTRFYFTFYPKIFNAIFEAT